MLNHRIIAFVFCFISTFSIVVITSIKSPSRSLASIEEHYLRIGTYELSSDNKIILIGIDNTNLVRGPWAMDASSIGFEPVSGSINQIDPRFLIVMNKTGVHSVHAFNIGKGDPGKLKSSGTTQQKFPETILKAENIRRQLLFKKPESFFKHLTKVITFIPKGTFEVFWNLFRKGKEDDKKRQAAYLMGILERHINDNRFPELEEALGSENLEELGALLSIRFHEKGVLGGILARPENRRELYKKLVHLKRDHASLEMDYLVSRANEEGLVVHPLGPYFAALFYDLKNPADKENWSGFRLDVDDPNHIEKNFKTLNIDNQHLVPLGIYVLGNGTNTKLINLHDENQNRKREFLKTAGRIASEAQAVFFPLGKALNFGVSVAKKFITFKIKKSGSTLFSDRLKNYSELLMILETGIADIEFDNSLKEVFISNLNDIVKDDLKREQLKKDLESADEKVSREAMLRLLSLNVHFQQGTWGGTGGESEEYKRAIKRSENWMKFIHWVSNQEKRDELDKKLNERAKEEMRKIASRLQRQNAQRPDLSDIELPEIDSKEKRPVIMFCVDGLRPDRIWHAAEKGLIPTMKKYFLDHGIEFKATSPNANTIPSWATILSGSDPDRHSLRGTTNASRGPNLDLESYIDFRVFTKPSRFYLQAKSSPAYEKLIQARATSKIEQNWLPGHIPEDEMIQGFMPVHNGQFVPFGGIIKKIKDHYVDDALFGVVDPAHAYDLGTAYNIVQKLKENPGKYRFVLQYVGSIDHAAHVGNRELDKGFQIIDHTMSEVLKAASEDPVLNKAVILLVSDHGVSGGFEIKDPTRPMLTDLDYELDNTTFNVIKFFAGDYPGVSRDFDFVVGSHKPGNREVNAGIFDFYKKGLFKPKHFVYKGKRDNKGREGYRGNSTVMIEPYGDGQVYVFMLEDANRSPAIKTSYYELTHYKMNETNKVVNIPEALLKYSVKNTDNKKVKFDDGSDLQEHLKDFNGLRPVGHFAMSLTGSDKIRESVSALTGDNSFDRPPVIVQRFGRETGLILTRGEGNQTEYRYFIIRNFNQLKDGTITGKIVDDPSSDPLEYNIDGKSFPSRWMTDREISQLTIDSWYPTGIYMLSKNLTLSPAVLENDKIKDRAMAETPDFILFAGYGFHFNSHQLHQGDHGGLSRYEVKNTFFVHDDQLSLDHISAPIPVMSRDITPTVLDFLGHDQFLDQLDGESLRPMIEDLRGEDSI